MFLRILDLIFDSFRFLKKEKMNFFISSITISLCILVVSLIYIFSLKVIQTIKSMEKPSIIINYKDLYDDCDDCNLDNVKQCPDCDIYHSIALEISSDDTDSDIEGKKKCKECIEGNLKLSDGESFDNYRFMSRCHEKCSPVAGSSYAAKSYDDEEYYQDLNKNGKFDQELEYFINNEYYGSRLKTSCNACISFKLLDFRNQIRFMNEINDEIEFINKHDALSKYEQFIGRYYFKNRPDRNIIPFPAQSKFTIDNSVNNIKDLNQLVNEIKSLEFVKDVDDESMINYSKFISYTKINKAISSLIPVLIFIIMFVPSLVTTNTIRLVIYSKRDILNTLKILGEKDFYIRLPFILEGAWQGMLGGFLAFMVLLSFDIAGLNVLMSKFVNVILSDISINNMNNTKLLINVKSFFTTISVGILLGVFGSVRATIKFLK